MHDSVLMEELEKNHYKQLAIEPKDIAKANFTKEELRGAYKWNILKYLLRQKGSTRSDAKKLLIYAHWLYNLELDIEREETHGEDSK